MALLIRSLREQGSPRKGISMQMDEAFQLQAEWKKSGNPHCDHPVVDREYYLGSHTGDSVCTTCGSYLNESETRGKKKAIEVFGHTGS